MLIVARAGAEDQVREVFAKWDLDAVVIGAVTDDGLFRVAFGGDEVVRLPVDPLAHGAPVYERPSGPPKNQGDLQQLNLADIAPPGDYGRTLLTILSSPNIASKAWVYRQYDQLVGANSVVPPGSDAAVVRIQGTGKAVVMSVDCNSRYCMLDPYVGAMTAVVESARNVACAGGLPIGITDCLNFGNPEKPEVMWQFREAIKGIRDACLALNVPVVSGNVSFYNETDGRPIPPTPTIAMVGLLDDVRLHTTQWFKNEGDVIVLLGRTREELGGSEYLAVVHGVQRGAPPWMDLAVEVGVQGVCRDAIGEGLVRSAHDVSEGGLAVAIAECCISGPQRLGAEIDMEASIRPDAWLFGESQSRIVLSVRPRHLSRLRELATAREIPLTVLGTVRGTRLRIGSLIDIDVAEMHTAWSRSVPDRMDG